MEWQEKYECGIAEIDKQHQYLFRMTGRLGSLIEEGRCSGPEIENLIGFFNAYAVSHFEYEEMCMRSRLCPVSEKNKKAHDAFKKYLKDLQLEFQTTGGDPESLKGLHSMLSDWLLNHICKIDIHLRNRIYK